MPPKKRRRQERDDPDSPSPPPKRTRNQRHVQTSNPASINNLQLLSLAEDATNSAGDARLADDTAIQTLQTVQPQALRPPQPQSLQRQALGRQAALSQQVTSSNPPEDLSETKKIIDAANKKGRDDLAGEDGVGTILAFKPLDLVPKLPPTRISVKPSRENRLFFSNVANNGNSPETNEDEHENDDDDDQDDDEDEDSDDEGSSQRAVLPVADEIAFSCAQAKERCPAWLRTLLAVSGSISRPMSQLIINNESRIHSVIRYKQTRTRNETPPQTRPRHLDYGSPPLADIYEIFEHMASEAARPLRSPSAADTEERSALKEACNAFKDFGLRVFTMCSGTEAPILALELFREQLEKHNLLLNYKHIASAEIEPDKQGYIELNFQPPSLFRDVTEFCHDKATTAYGALTDVPGDCHIVVAGSACVDYSPLNRVMKNFADKGESFSTMAGVLSYCTKHLPCMVLLENVKGAPWMKGQKNITKIWRRVGYDVAVVWVDTKDYYIPQTRQRGYLLGFHQKRAEAQGFDTKTALTRWVHYFRALSSRASASYTEFINNNDSLENEITRRRSETAAVASKKEIDWALCKQRYYALRNSNNYGQLRPFTRWDANGSSTCFDFVWQRWMRMQRDRVLDTLDIAYLRYLVDRDYDMNGKSRTVDLSQNIDRDLDSKHWGIVGCLTGTGLLYDTYRGGVISGDEALKLQGIPVDDLILDKLSNKTKINLAGNAMTSTVIGTALICAIMAGVNGQSTIFHKPADKKLCLEYKKLNEDSDATMQDPDMLGLEKSETPLWNTVPARVDKLKQFAWDSRQLCACEGLSGQIPIHTITICKECGHTVCATCHGQPDHDYESMTTRCNYNRASPRDFISFLEKQLPRSLNIDKLGDDFKCFWARYDPFPDNSSEHAGAWPGRGSMAADISQQFGIDQDLDVLRESYRETVIQSISKPFHYRGIKRDTSWKVDFSSSFGRLRLVMRPKARRPSELQSLAGDCVRGMECQWLLYATCASNVALGSRLREALAEPIARMTPIRDLFDGQWEVREERRDSATAVIAGSESDEALESQARSGIQMRGLKSLKVFNALSVTITSDSSNGDDDVSTILGEVTTFRRLGKCGTSNDLLYRASEIIEGGSMYLLLGAGHLQDAKYDSMILANDHERLPRGDVRSSLVKFASGWRPVHGEDCAPFRGTVRCDQILWKQMASLALSADTKTVSIWSVGGPSLQGQGCTQGCRLALSVDLPEYDELSSSFGGKGTHSVDLQDRRGRLKPLFFAVGSIEPPVALSGAVLAPGPFPRGNACEECAPAPLRLQWRWFRSRGSSKKVIRPLEDANEAKAREASVKARPVVAAARLQLFGLGDGLGGRLQLDLNPMALVHRAVAPIQRYGSSNSRIEAEWCIRTYHDLDVADAFVPAPLQSTADHIGEESAGLRRSLYARQMKTLGWMLEVEQGKTTWKEQNVKEQPIKFLRWTVIARAWRSISVRGGVLADGIGTGKTTVALSLVGRDLSNLRQVRDETTGAAVEVRRAATTATLVLVPANLVMQWLAQAAKCFTADIVKQIVKIDNFVDLQNHSVDVLARAPIILMSLKVFEDGAYWNHLGNMCYAPDVPAANGRALRQWLDVVDRHLDVLHDSSQRFQDLAGFDGGRDQLRHNNVYKDNANDYYGFRKKSDMKHLDPKELMSVTAPKTNVTDTDRAAMYPVRELDHKGLPRTYGELRSSKTKTILPHPHMMFFRRIIVDEFQYLSPAGYVAVQTLKSSTRWLISGTPPLHDVDGVDATARLLLTRITSRPDDVVSQGFDLGQKANEKIVERSYVEEFTDYSDLTFIASTNLHNKLSTQFIGLFVRGNEADTKGSVVKEHVIAVRPQTRELLASIHFYTTLNNQAVKYATKLTPPTTLHDLIITESKRPPWKPHMLCTISGAIIKAFSNALNPEMALLTCHTTYALWRNPPDGNATTTKEPAAYWIYMANEIHSLTTMLTEHLQEATSYWIEAENNQNAKYENEKNDLPLWATDIVRRGNLGEPDVTWFIDDLLGYANDQPERPRSLLSAPPNAPSNLRDDVTPKTRNREMNKRCSIITFVVNALSGAIRQARFFKSVEAISELQGIHCDVCDKGFSTYANYQILSTCGHVYCKNCLNKVGKDGNDQMDKAEDDKRTKQGSNKAGKDGNDNLKYGAPCCIEGCDRTIEKSNLCSAGIFNDTAPYSPIESRGNAVVSIIKERVFNNVEKPTDKEEYAVIFVQYMAHLNELTAAFDNNKIKYVNGCVAPTTNRGVTRDNKETKARELIENFKLDAMLGNRKLGPRSNAFSRDLPDDAKDQRGKTPNAHVLILMLDSEDAAGWNLQVCNHVIFAAPYIAHSNIRYDEVMQQAIGRASRNGQSKEVHVYHVALARTTETAILSERRGGDRDLVWTDSNVSEFAADWVPKDKKRSPLVSLLGPKLNIQGLIRDNDDDDDEHDENGEDTGASA
jgi:site-specific DNA-cytosine methylase